MCEAETRITWKDLTTDDDVINQFEDWCWPYNVDPRRILEFISAGHGRKVVALLDTFSGKYVTSRGPKSDLDDIGIPVRSQRDPEGTVASFIPRWARHRHAESVLEKLIDTQEIFRLTTAWNQLQEAHVDAVTALVKCGAPVEGALNRASSENIKWLLRALVLARRKKDLRWSPDMLYELALDQYVVTGPVPAEGAGDERRLTGLPWRDEAVTMYQATCKRKFCSSWRIALQGIDEVGILQVIGVVYKLHGKEAFPESLLEMMVRMGASLRLAYSQAVEMVESLAQSLDDEYDAALQEAEAWQPEDPEDEEEWDQCPGVPFENEVVSEKLRTTCIGWLQSLRAKEVVHLRCFNLWRVLQPSLREHAPRVAAFAVGPCRCAACRNKFSGV